MKLQVELVALQLVSGTRVYVQTCSNGMCVSSDMCDVSGVTAGEVVRIAPVTACCHVFQFLNCQGGKTGCVFPVCMYVCVSPVCVSLTSVKD